jgi:hypothetical protein
MPSGAAPHELPLLIETQCAGDFTRGNKKRAEDAARVATLRGTYGHTLRFVLVLWGYFDTGYLGSAAAEGIDWVWQHRIDDLEHLIVATPLAVEHPFQSNGANGATMPAVAASTNRAW